MNNKCKIIVFEGIDGAGKSTQVKKLNDLLNGNGKKSIIMKGYDLFNGLKETLYNRFNYIDPIETFFITLAKHKAIEMQIKNILDSYDYIIIDRFIYTTFAYTMANIKPEKRGEIHTISNILENHFINIDYLIYIETSPQIAWKRKNNVIEDIETGNNSDKNTDTRTLFINNQTSANEYYKLFFQNKTNLLKLSGEMDKDILSDIIYRKVSSSIE